MSETREVSAEFSADHFINAGDELFSLLEKHPDLNEKAIARAQAMLESDDHDVEGILVSAAAHLIYLIAMGQALENDRMEATP